MVESETVIGRVLADTGTASKVMPEPVMKVIRELTEFPRLRRGTLNVKVEEAHVHRRDYTLLPGVPWGSLVSDVERSAYIERSLHEVGE